MRIHTGVMGASLFLVALAVGCDNKIPSNATPLPVLLEKLESNGISRIKEVKFEDGYWEIEGIHSGKEVEVHVNPSSGAIVLETPDPHPSLPGEEETKASAIARFVENAGFTQIYELDWQHEYWDVVAYQGKDRHVLKVESSTGKILSDRVENIQHFAP